MYLRATWAIQIRAAKTHRMIGAAMIGYHLLRKWRLTNQMPVLWMRRIFSELPIVGVGPKKMRRIQDRIQIHHQRAVKLMRETEWRRKARPPLTSSLTDSSDGSTLYEREFGYGALRDRD
jgi:hypothetical protein